MRSLSSFFYNKYQDIGKAIERATEAYRVGDGHIARYKRRLGETLRLEGFEQESLAQLPDREEVESRVAEE